MIAEIEGVWTLNMNFMAVPIELVEQMKGVSKTEWVLLCKWYNQNPSVWNLGFNTQEGVKAFMYGYWEPLDRELRITRISVDKSLFSYEGKVLYDAIDALRILAKNMQVKQVYFETVAWRVFMRKLKGDIRLSKAMILEVL